MRFSAWVPLLLTAACSSPTVVGGFELRGTDKGFSLHDGRDVLLDSFLGSAAYAPVAVRRVETTVDMRAGAFSFTDAESDWREARSLTWGRPGPSSTVGTWRDSAGRTVAIVEALSPGAGELFLGFAAADQTVNRFSVTFSCRADDHFLGFGGQTDAVDHRGHTVSIWNSEAGDGKALDHDGIPTGWPQVGTRHASGYGLPTWLSNRGYVAVVGADTRTVFELCSVESGAFRIEAHGPRFALWLFRGGNGASPLMQATGRVLGRPGRPPPLAFAPWHHSLFGASALRSVAQALRDGGIPSSLIWTNDVHGGEEVGDTYQPKLEWDIDATLYPDAGGLAAELRGQGFGWLTTFDPRLVQDSRIFAEAVDGGHLVSTAAGTPYLFTGPTSRPTGLIDLSTSRSRDWVKEQLRRAVAVGFSGWTAPGSEWLPHDAVVASKVSALEAHNRYPLWWSAVNQEVLSEPTDGGVTVFAARAGWSLSNVYAPVTWGGDQRTDFGKDDGLASVVPMAINLGLAGVSNFGSDLGGAQSSSAPPTTRELFFRWTQLAALSPVMRTHHGSSPRRQWRFDADAETLAHYRRWATFHMQLFPYLFTHATVAAETGIPIVRALPLAFPDDEAGWTIDDQYLLGVGLMVAPVLKEGATSRVVHLPPGEWVSLSEGVGITGPMDYLAAAPLTEIPLFARAGALIPRLSPRIQTLAVAPGLADWNEAKLERSLLVVTGGRGAFEEADGTLYELQASSGTRFAQDDRELAECTSSTERGCLDRSGQNVVVRMRDSTTSLEVPGYRLQMSGPPHRYDVELVVPSRRVP